LLIAAARRDGAARKASRLTTRGRISISQFITQFPKAAFRGAVRNTLRARQGVLQQGHRNAPPPPAGAV